MFTSDLGRALETTSIAFEGTSTPVLSDWRLREWDFGESNGAPAAPVHADRRRHLDEPYPQGESWRQAIARVDGFVDDLPGRWAGQRILIIGHVATRWALDQRFRGRPLSELIEEDFGWREGWEYQIA